MIDLTDTSNGIMIQAINENWDIEPEWRTAILKQLVKIVIDPATSPREKTAAAKAVMLADSINKKHAQATAEHNDRAKFLAVADTLGIGDRFRGADAGRSTSNIITIDGATSTGNTGTAKRP